MRLIIFIFIFTAGHQGFSNLLYTEYYEGPVKILESEGHEGDEFTKISLGKDVNFQIRIFQTEFFGRNIISANALIKNDTASDVLAVYSVAFFDAKKKLIGCVQGNWDLAKNTEVDYGSGIVYTDADSVRRIESMKILISVFE